MKERILKRLLIWKLSIIATFRMLICYIKEPFLMISSVIKDYRFRKAHPSRWEQYVENRRIENELNKNNHHLDIVNGKLSIALNIGIAHSQILEYINRNDPDYEPEDVPTLEDIEQRFSRSKSVALERMAYCERLGVSFPVDFKFRLLKLNITSFRTKSEVEASCDEFIKMLHDHESESDKS